MAKMNKTQLVYKCINDQEVCDLNLSPLLYNVYFNWYDFTL